MSPVPSVEHHLVDFQLEKGTTFHSIGVRAGGFKITGGLDKDGKPNLVMEFEMENNEKIIVHLELMDALSYFMLQKALIGLNSMCMDMACFGFTKEQFGMPDMEGWEQFVPRPNTDEERPS